MSILIFKGKSIPKKVQNKESEKWETFLDNDGNKVYQPSADLTAHNYPDIETALYELFSQCEFGGRKNTTYITTGSKYATEDKLIQPENMSNEKYIESLSYHRSDANQLEAQVLAIEIDGKDNDGSVHLTEISEGLKKLNSNHTGCTTYSQTETKNRCRVFIPFNGFTAINEKKGFTKDQHKHAMTTLIDKLKSVDVDVPILKEMEVWSQPWFTPSREKDDGQFQFISWYGGEIFGSNENEYPEEYLSSVVHVYSQAEVSKLFEGNNSEQQNYSDPKYIKAINDLKTGKAIHTSVIAIGNYFASQGVSKTFCKNFITQSIKDSPREQSIINARLDALDDNIDACYTHINLKKEKHPDLDQDGIEMLSEYKMKADKIIPKSSEALLTQNIADCWLKTFWVGSSHAHCLNRHGALPSYSEPKFNQDTIRKLLFGYFVNFSKLEKLASNQVSGDKEPEKAKKELLKLWHVELNKILTGYLQSYRQRKRINYTVNMFAEKPILKTIKNDYESISRIGIHHPFEETGYDPLIIADYKKHFPEFDNVLDCILGARFSPDRKEAFYWLHAKSDWGKNLFIDIFKELNLIVVISEDELKMFFKGSPIGKTAQQFDGAWILAFDEVKYVNAEIKQLANNIRGSAKNQLEFIADVYAKIFLSAEIIDSLVGGVGVEGQFNNRFAKIPTIKASIKLRQKFIEVSNGIYFKSLVGYVAEYLNKGVERYRALGKEQAGIEGSKVIEAYRAKNNLVDLYGSIEDEMKDIAEHIKAEIQNPSNGNVNGLFGTWIDKKNILKTIHNEQKVFVIKKPDSLVKKYINQNVEESQRKRILYKAREIACLMDDNQAQSYASSTPKPVSVKLGYDETWILSDKDKNKSPKPIRCILINALNKESS